MAWLGKRGAEYETYQRELCETRLIASLKAALLFVIGLNTVFAPLDIWTQPDHLGALLALRAIWNASLGLLYFCADRFNPIRMTQVACVVTGLALIALIGTAGGVDGGTA